MPDVIARILEREPDWSAFPTSVPARLRDVVQRCFTKDVERRPRDIGDLCRELAGISYELSAPAGGRASQAAAIPSLAVLYFENLANDAESEYFCAGMTEDILTDLSKIKGLRVASRNAVAPYRGTTVEIPNVAAEFGVGAVLEGSVRRAGDRVRITAQLINAADGFHLWEERYDRTMQGVFAVQEEIASSIVAVSLCFINTQILSALAMNSGPLSLLRTAGAPCLSNNPPSTAITRSAFTDPPTSIARHSRVHSSMTVSAFSFCPLPQASCTKS